MTPTRKTISRTTASRAVRFPHGSISLIPRAERKKSAPTIKRLTRAA